MLQGVVVGAGDRGANAYVSLLLAEPHLAKIVGVAEPNPARRHAFAARYGVPADAQFDDHRALFASPRRADFAVIATPDALHAEPTVKALEAGYAVLLEKPMAVTEDDCEMLVAAAERTGEILQICHVLRYAPLYAAIKQVVDAGEIGDIVTIQHSENVSYFHYAHSYCRGNWRNRGDSSPMILAKSCHDLDILYWLAGAPPRRLTSLERPTELCLENAPADAPERCIDGCPHSSTCAYDAVAMYRDMSPLLLDIRKRTHEEPHGAGDVPRASGWSGWPVSVITDDTTPEGVDRALRTTNYGRCVYRVGDNDQPSSQHVGILFENGVNASFTMHSTSYREGRETRIDGTRGSIVAGFYSLENTVLVHDHKTGSVRSVDLPAAAGSHGGSDPKLFRAFLAAVRGEVSPITSAAESLWSHRMAFAADRAGRDGVVVDWQLEPEERNWRTKMIEPAPTRDAARPKNAIVVLLDSLNRHMLGAYGGSEFDTPNLDRFAARSLRFDRHYSGSLPCMPARHDILCGALDFLWRPWGSVEIWEEALTYQVRREGVVTMLVSDHPHLFETGGENYHTDFHAWEYIRGHEGDPWKTVADRSAIGAPEIPAAKAAPMGHRPYDTSRTWFREEADFPGPKTMATACSWLDANAGAHDRFLLFIDEFDPHEPFDTPEPYASAYDPTWKGPKLIWPPYAVGPIARGTMSERDGRQVRASYGGGLSMIDHWFGKLLDTIDAHRLADDTLIIVCTDHGHYLGEPTVDGQDIWGKPGVPLYETLGHTPFFVAWPGRGAGSVDALTTNVDIYATLMDLFGAEPAHRTHGRSLLPILEGHATSVREWALAGIWGRQVHVLDGVLKYARAHTGENAPLSMWSNRWSTMPIHAFPALRLPRPDKRAWLDFMPGTDVPVIRQPFARGDMLPYWAAGARAGDHYLFDLEEDPGERRNLVDTAREKQSIDLLRAALDEVEAPAEQLERLGIA